MFSPFKVKMNDFIAEKYPGTEKLLFFWK
jgi:hypothetical protein